MKRKSVSCTGGVILLVCLLLVFPAEAQQESRTGRFTAGAGLGLQGGTSDGTAFAVGFNVDYFLTHNLALGPLLQIGVTGDLTQIGFSLQAKYTLDIVGVPAFKPHFQGGFGFIYADLDLGRFGSADDTSFLIPLGLGAEYRLSEKLSLDSTLLFNFTDLNVVRDDSFFITWFIGARLYF